MRRLVLLTTITGMALISLAGCGRRESHETVMFDLLDEMNKLYYEYKKVTREEMVGQVRAPARDAAKRFAEIKDRFDDLPELGDVAQRRHDEKYQPLFEAMYMNLYNEAEAVKGKGSDGGKVTFDIGGPMAVLEQHFVSAELKKKARESGMGGMGGMGGGGPMPPGMGAGGGMPPGMEGGMPPGGP